MNNSAEYKRAKERAENKLGFYIHFTIYIAVILLLLVINLMTSRDHFWFQWPMMGWGIAIVIHAWITLVLTNRFSVKEKMIQRELNKERE